MSERPPSQFYGVVGDPVSHSLSPLIHNRWIGEAGIDAHYSAIHLQAADAAPSLRLLVQNYAGLNVTLPHKRAALAASASASPEALAVGAANTLMRERLGWRAHNTDVAGFADALSAAAGEDLKGRRVVLIGAGGAARAAALHLVRLGVQLVIVNRSAAKADALVRDLAPEAQTAALDQLAVAASQAAVIVNSASLGHAGAELPDLPAGKDRPFLDLSYSAAAAPALRQAREAGWAPHDGLTMLVAQAAEAFRIWFGISPDTAGALDACRAAVAARQ